MTQYITSKQVVEAVVNTPQVVFETTDACNLKCTYCLYGELYSSYGTRNTKFLSSKLAIRFLEELFDLWKSNIVLSAKQHTFISFYGGEPLLNMPFIIDVVSFINEQKKNGLEHQFSFTITTNGILLDRYIDFLVENDFDVLVSLDGNEVNNSYRVFKDGTSSHRKLCENLEFVKEQYPVFFEKRVSFNAVLHNRNSLSDTVGYIWSKYGKIPTISEMNATGVNLRKQSLFDEMYQSADDSFRDDNNGDALITKLGSNSKLYKALQRYVQCYSSRFYEDYLDLLRNNDRPKLPTGTCIPFSRKIFITVNGEIFPCERIPHKFIMGKIQEDGISIDYEDCAQKYNSLLSGMEKICKNCFNKKGCVQCVYCISDECFGSKCNGFMNREAFMLYERKMIGYLSKHPEIYSRILNDTIIL